VLNFFAEHQSQAAGHNTWRQSSFESKRAHSDFQEFIKAFQEPAAKDVSKQCKMFMEKISENQVSYLCLWLNAFLSDQSTNKFSMRAFNETIKECVSNLFNCL